MRTSIRTLGGLVLGMALIAGAVASARQDEPKPEGPAEKAGESLDRALKDLRRGAKDIARDVREGFARTRARVDAMGIEARVYGRIHWDRNLEHAPITLEVSKEGVATLGGSVPNEAARAKAITLTRDTVGITDVVDRMTVTPPAVETEERVIEKTSP